MVGRFGFLGGGKAPGAWVFSMAQERGDSGGVSSGAMDQSGAGIGSRGTCGMVSKVIENDQFSSFST
jgi:hypothetical protein